MNKKSNASKSKALVTRTNKNVSVDKSGNLIEGQYKTPFGDVRVKKIKPATKYDVINVARAMNDDFAPKLKELFDPEQDACIEAVQTGLYISYRPIDSPMNQQDCIRISSKGKCFCSHLLNEHEKFTGSESILKCRQLNCPCKAFSWVPSRPEESGEFWLRKRRDFIAAEYKAKCRCKHSHDEHKAYPSPYKCKVSGCGCSMFYSAFVCAACDLHWHRHQTVLETENERKNAGRPIGKDWLPFAELPELRDMAITGENNLDIQSLRDALPIKLQTSINKSLPNSNFRAIHD